jgi:O-antigen/teichoic acid export membrane protein
MASTHSKVIRLANRIFNIKSYLRSPASSLGNRFALGAFWSMSGTAIAQALALIASIVTARLLGKTVFGEFGMIYTTALTFGSLAGLGIGMTATRYVAEWRTKDAQRTGRIMGLSMIAAIVAASVIVVLILIFADSLASQTLNAPHLVNELRISCLILFFAVINGAQIGILSGLEAFKRIALVGLIRGLITFPITLIGVIIFKLDGALIAMILSNGIGLILSEDAIRKECNNYNIQVIYQGVSTELPILWKFSLPAFLSNLVIGPVLWLGNTMLVNQPGGYGEIGLLNAANQWRALLMFIPNIISSVALPMLSNEVGVRSKETNFNQLMDLTQSIAVITVVPLSTILIFMGSWIMGLNGKDFNNGGSIFLGIIVGITISAIGNAAGTALQAKQMMWLGAFMNFTWGLLYILFSWYFVGSWGAKALSTAWAIAYLILTLWAYLYLFITKIVTSKMVIRMISSVVFILVISTIFMITRQQVHKWLIIPAFLLSLWISFKYWAIQPVRQFIYEKLNTSKAVTGL